ncbi:uncharacterized protein LOC124209837 isoform X1 [Daphnia pulex]|uniref:uncharacterized protein LOC124209837 isoform X1 n=1 Tax=Daphnia pulex TaxID=6669 RepID=UPI001EE0794F|nr:uncharacterized protein LOC124209837 isoform X1 [Daphnia pulex]
MVLNWAICIAVAAAIHRVQLVVVSEDIRFLKESQIEQYDNNTGEEDNDLAKQSSFHLSFQTQPTEDGPMIVPWINHVGIPHNSPPTLPICYNQSPNQKAGVVRLAHVICRQLGFMTVTKWFGISKEAVGLHLNSTGLSAYCRGDEQFVDHCQWQRPIVPSCSHILAIECGDCSRSYLMTEETRITLASPGFPVYIPLVVCEWNITSIPENNLLIRFQQFELPSPVYDESVNDVSCRSGSLDVMSYHEDINKMALDGRFCGRYSPGNLTIFSNRILIRFTANSFKMEAITKKGFLAECSLVSAVQLSNHIAVVRWVLIGCAILFSVITALFLWVWKGNLRKFCLHFCLSYWGNNSPTNEDHPSLARSPRPTAILSSSVTPFSRIPGLEEQQIESIYRRSRNGVKVPVQVCDSRHLEQTRRLEKWHSSNHPRSSSVDFISMQSINPLTKKDISVAANAKEKDESHVYEEIDIGLQNGCSEISCIHAKTSTTSPPRIIMPFVSRSHYEPPRIMPYQQKSPPEPSSTSVLVSGSQLPSRVHQPLRDPSHGRACPCFSCRNSGSIFSTPSYFPQSSESGDDSASLSGIYISPEPDSEE